MARYPVGAAVKVHYNPDQPTHATLQVGENVGAQIGVVVGLLVALAGVVVALMIAA